MAKFNVTIRDVSTYEHEGIEAENEKEAEEIAMRQQNYDADEYFSDQDYEIDTMMTED